MCELPAQAARGLQEDVRMSKRKIREEKPAERREYLRTKPRQYTARLGNVWIPANDDARLRAVCKSRQLGRADVVRAALRAELSRLEASKAA